MGARAEIAPARLGVQRLLDGELGQRVQWPRVGGERQQRLIELEHPHRAREHAVVGRREHARGARRVTDLETFRTACEEAEHRLRREYRVRGRRRRGVRGPRGVGALLEPREQLLEIRGNMGRYDETWGAMGSYGELWGAMGKYTEIWGDMGYHASSRAAHQKESKGIRRHQKPSHLLEKGGERLGLIIGGGVGRLGAPDGGVVIARRVARAVELRHVVFLAQVLVGGEDGDELGEDGRGRARPARLRAQVRAIRSNPKQSQSISPPSGTGPSSSNQKQSETISINLTAFGHRSE